MFDLERAIAEWRQQMLAAGIKTPTPLEELECHLREGIEQQVKASASQQQAFESSTAQIGQAEALKQEFTRAKGLRGLFGDDQITRTHRLLGILWLVFYSWGILTTLGLLFSLFNHILHATGSFRLTPGFLVIFLLAYIYIRGVGGSISLFRGKNQGRRIIRFFATLCVIAFVAQQIAIFKSVSISGDILTLFSLATIWLLRPPQKTKLAT